MTIFYKKNLTKTSKWLRHSLSLMILMFCLVMGLRGQNNALNFDGTNDYVNTTVSGIPVGNSSRTVEVWVKTTQSSIGNIVSWGTRSGNQRNSVAVRSNSIGFIGESNDQTGATVINDDKWHHLAFTYNSSTNNLRLYIDGNIEVNATISALNTTGTNLRIGVNASPSLDEYFNGVLDEVRIWNVVRTQSEIQTNMKNNLTGSESGLVVYYNFNEGTSGSNNTGISSPEIQDITSNNNDGMLTNFAKNGASSNWVGSRTNALNFDGIDDYVNISGGGGLNNLQTGTIEMWVRWTGTQDADVGSGFGPVISRQSNGAFSNQIIALNNSNPASANIIWKPYNAFSIAITSSVVAGNNVWNHIAITFSSGSHTMYVNGVSVGTSSLTGTINNNNSVPLAIGAWIGDGTGYSTSTIDEVRIWNTTRTCDQIRSVMNRELLGTESNLVAYYNFNQGVAGGNNAGITTLTDLAGGNDNGTLTNFTLTGATSNWVDATSNGVTDTTPLVPAEINVSVGINGSTKDVGGYATGTPVDFTYIIQNLGGASLSLTGSPRLNITSGSGFTVLTQPSTATIAGGSSTIFVIRFSPTVLGTSYSTTFSLSNSDCDEGTYTFTLTGKSISATPSGLRGNMMSFDGVNGGVSTSTVASTATANITVEGWVKIAGYPTSDAGLIYNGSTGANGYGFYIDNTGQLRVLFGLINFYNTGFTIPLNTWQHIALVSSANNWSVYINGSLMFTFVSTPNTPSGRFVAGAGFNAGSLLNFFNGSIDEIRFWNATRTQAQIRENMHLTLSGSETGLAAYYQFNESSGNTIDAISGNNGTLNNSPTRTTSTVSVAKGISTRQTISSAGSTSFGNLIVNFATMSAPAANDEFVGYQLYDTPLNNVSGVTSTTSNYWLVRQFGTQTFTYDQMTYVIPSSNTISAADEAAPTNFKLYKRAHNSAGAWGTAIGTGLSASNASHTIIYTISPAQSSFSELIPTSTGSSSLPITLIKFEGKRIDNQQVLLTWQTANELNNQGFEIEQSIDNQSFNKIGFVDGANNSNSIRNYQFTIINSESAYYRLKQIDTDGKYNYSASVYVKGNEINNFILYPNPAAETLNMELNGKQASSEVINLRVYNAQGNQIWTKTSTLTEIQSLLNTHFKTWKAGLYLIQIQTKDGVKQVKLIKY